MSQAVFGRSRCGWMLLMKTNLARHVGEASRADGSMSERVGEGRGRAGRRDGQPFERPITRESPPPSRLTSWVRAEGRNKRRTRCR